MTRPPERPISREPWPGPTPDALPYDDPPHLDLEAAWANHVGAGGGLDRPTHDAAVAVVRDAIATSWSDGRTERLTPLLGPLRLDGARRDDYRRLPPADAVAPLIDVVRIATDLVPATGNAAVDRLLGPWADALDAARAPALYRQVTAHGAFLLPDDLPMSAFQRWAGRTPLPTPEERAAVRAIAHAPLSVWPIEAMGADGWRLGHGVGLERPEALVEVPSPAALPGATAAPGQLVAGRLIDRRDAPPLLWGALIVPGPLPAAAEAWVDLLTLEQRLLERRASTADVLRERGHLLVQRVLEAAWLAT